MAEVKQIMLTPDPPGNLVKGNRNDENLRACFPDSPLPGYAGAVYSDLERTTGYQEKVLSGDRASGHGINNFNLDFEGDGTVDGTVPDIAGMTHVKGPNGTLIKIGEGRGAPTTQYIPPLTSPGETVSATEQKAYTGTTKDPESNVEFGSGLGGLASPADTSKEIAQQSVLSNYVSGRSYASSGG